MNYLFRLLTISIAAAVSTADGAVTETHEFLALGLAVPDGQPSGVANLQTVSSTIGAIDSIKVSINLSTTYNGDLYAYLTHGSGFAVLLNRPGRSSLNLFGYSDEGIDVSFSDLASADIHNYQDTVSPGSGNPLTGEWLPDARIEDPDFVFDTDPRVASLSSFNSLDPDGAWTLYVADLVTGDAATLNSWSLEITGALVPEPSGTVLLLLGLGALVVRRRR